jgi:hypothetical protein
MPRPPAEYSPGTLVFLPRSSCCYSAVWVVARLTKGHQVGHVDDQTRYVCHRVDLETGLPMVCPDQRCKERGLACCAITINSGWHDEVEPLTKDEIDLFSTEQPTVLDRKFAKKCLAFVPPVVDRAKATRDFAKFVDGLLR